MALSAFDDENSTFIGIAGRGRNRPSLDNAHRQSRDSAPRSTTFSPDFLLSPAPSNDMCAGPWCPISGPRLGSGGRTEAKWIFSRSCDRPRPADTTPCSHASSSIQSSPHRGRGGACVDFADCGFLTRFTRLLQKLAQAQGRTYVIPSGTRNNGKAHPARCQPSEKKRHRHMACLHACW